MKTDIFLELPKEVRLTLWQHLVRPDSDSEQVAFVYASTDGKEQPKIFRHVDWFPVPREGFVLQSEFHLELTDQIRALVIKRAHDLGTSLVEFHFHSGPWAARFSYSDLLGFRDFVPHVWWRLKGRPYLAVVVSRSGFDALVWLEDPNTPQHLGGILVDSKVYKPTALTSLSWKYDDEEKI